jgi:hypothetical protein
LTDLPENSVLWFLFHWLWLVWISIICPSSVIFAIIAVASTGERSNRYKKLAFAFAAIAAVWTFVFLVLLLLL